MLSMSDISSGSADDITDSSLSSSDIEELELLLEDIELDRKIQTILK